MSTKKDGATEVRFNVRITPALHEKLVRRAKVNGRSMNSEVVAILEGSIEDAGDAGLRALRSMIAETATRLRESEQATHSLRDRLATMQQELEIYSAAAEARRKEGIR